MRNLAIAIAVVVILAASVFLIYKAIHVDISKSIPNGATSTPRSGCRSFGIPAIRVDEVSGLLHKAEAASARGDYEAAIKDLGILISRYPESPQAELAFFTLASVYEKKGELLKSREAYQKILEKFAASPNVQRAQEQLEDINLKILFSPAVMEGSVSYQVQKGDSLKKIAAKYNTTIELLTRINNIKGGAIQIGRRLKIPQGRFSIVVDKSQSILTLKCDGNIVKTYSVSTGLNDSTPAGTFKITTKVVNPTWYTLNAVIPPGSPRNILGSRWMGISKEGYGIHGTTDPRSIGKNVTAGCIRMRNPDVEELYTIVPEGTEVVIID
jgi:lipoprotein-anchoring transpeptidase ErfK/SrfK